MSKVNLKKDAFFRKRIKAGEYKVSKKTGHIFNRFGKRLGTVNSRGYVTIGSKNEDGKLLIIQAHRVVWMYFNGKIPLDLILNHKDGNKQNNRLKNLELMTEAENAQHAVDMGLIVPFFKQGNKLHKARKMIGNRFGSTTNYNHVPYELLKYGDFVPANDVAWSFVA